MKNCIIFISDKSHEHSAEESFVNSAQKGTY